MPSSTMEFDTDILTAIAINSYFLKAFPQHECEMLLRTMELFDRVKMSVTKFPKFLVVIACYSVSNLRGTAGALIFSSIDT
jgi:hypothetical protein